ncbi:hypothetical protein ACFL6I_04025 [candidate division KSB1 bacterium]
MRCPVCGREQPFEPELETGVVITGETGTIPITQAAPENHGVTMHYMFYDMVEQT